jgi:hypothetical protein
LSKGLAGVLALIAAGTLVSACESTQDKSAKLAKEAKKVVQAKGLTVTKENPNVSVLSTALVHDQNGTAAVVELRNKTNRPLVALPLAIDVTDSAGKSLFKNSAAGLAPSLVQAALIPPRGKLTWVDDQVQVSADPHAVKAKVGVPAKATPGEDKPPEIVVGTPHFENDEVSGLAATGRVTNKSKIDQRQLTIFVVARKGGRVVAAGRGEIDRLKAGKSKPYTVFFIGNPKGAQLTVSAPPTTFQ